MAQRPKPHAKAKPPRLCPVPGCGRALAKHNASGVCRDHNHVAPHCRCPQCAGAAVPVRRGLQDRPDVRRVTLPAGISAAPGCDRVTISLPLEPWLRGKA